MSNHICYHCKKKLLANENLKTYTIGICLFEGTHIVPLSVPLLFHADCFAEAAGEDYALHIQKEIAYDQRRKQSEVPGAHDDKLDAESWVARNGMM